MKHSFTLGQGPFIKVIFEGPGYFPVEQMQAIFAGRLPPVDENRSVTQTIRISHAPDGSPETISYRASLDSGSPVCLKREGELVQWYENAVSSILLRWFKGWDVFHAGAVALDGRGIVIPGRRGAGKSTFTAALSLLGFEYLSDEAALVDHDLGLHPFPKAISLEAGGWRCIRDIAPKQAQDSLVWAPKEGESGKWYVQPPTHKAGSKSQVYPVDFVVLLRRGSGISTAEIPKSEALAGLVDQHMTLWFSSRTRLKHTVEMVRRARCLAIDTFDVNRAVDDLARTVTQGR